MIPKRQRRVSHGERQCANDGVHPTAHKRQSYTVKLYPWFADYDDVAVKVVRNSEIDLLARQYERSTVDRAYNR